MRPVGDYRDTCGACVHFVRDEAREREQAEIWPWTAGWPVHMCDIGGQVVEAGDSPNACRSAAEGCTDFARRGRKGGARMSNCKTIVTFNSGRTIKAQAKYDAENTRQVHLKLNRRTDKDVIARLDEVPSKQGYIKRLIRADLKK